MPRCHIGDYSTKVDEGIYLFKDFLSSILMLILVLSLLMTWTCVFPMLMVKLNFLLHSWTLLTSNCKSFSYDARRTISPANLKLLMIWPCIFMPTSTSSMARRRTSSRRILNSWGERIHPCLTPVWVGNQSVNSWFTRTALLDVL